jgi:hypothetical protein
MAAFVLDASYSPLTARSWVCEYQPLYSMAHALPLAGFPGFFLILSPLFQDSAAYPRIVWIAGQN